MKTRNKVISRLLIAWALVLMLGGLVLPVASAEGACTDFNVDNVCDTWDELFGDDDDDSGKTGGVSFSDFQTSGGIKPLSDKETIEKFDSTLTQSTDLKGFIITVVNYALGFLGLFAVLIVIYGGILYVSSGGETDKTEKGKKAIMYAAIGLIIVLGSFAFVNTVIKSGGGLGGDSSNGGTETGSVVGENSFNAAAEQIKSIAENIYNGYVFFAEALSEIENIKNDANKFSIWPTPSEDGWDKDPVTPQELPGKGEIQTYLFSLKGKLNNMQSKLSAFTEGEIQIKKLLIEVETVMDKIDSLNTPYYIKTKEGVGDSPVTIEYCPRDKAPQHVDDTSNAEDYTPKDRDDFKAQSEYSNVKDWWCVKRKGYDYVYTKDLYETWANFKSTFVEGEVVLLLNNFKIDYISLLDENMEVLGDTWKFLSQLDAVKTGQASEYFTQTIENYGYSYNAATGKMDKKSSDANLRGAVSHIVLGDIYTQKDAGNYLLKGLGAQKNLYEEILKIQFVNVVMSANVVSGNAPLTITFNVGKSVDPAGKSLDKTQILWDMIGEKTLQELLEDTGNGIVSGPETSSIVNCEVVAGDEAASTALIGETSQRCTYNKPGTYNVAVRIISSDPTKYGPGVAVMRITINPPATKIDLTLEAAGDTVQVMQYSNDLLVTDRDTVSISANTSGDTLVTFDAENTNPEPKQCRWTFGDGEITAWQDTCVETDHPYKDPGKYNVKLEVLSQLGVIDSKSFILNISSISARLKAIPAGGAFINNEVAFDGSGSKSNLGPIKQYEWSIDAAPGCTLPPSAVYPVTDSGPDLRIFKHTFENGGKYKIDLTVTDAKGEASDSISSYQVKSKSPVALYEYEVIDANSQPSTIRFDASKTYDPDGSADTLEYKWTITAKDGENNGQWQYINPETGVNESEAVGSIRKNPLIKFAKKGEYDVNLKVTDPASVCSAGDIPEQGELTKTINITDTLGVKWSADQKTVATLDAGEASMEFEFEVDNAQAYEIDFGDGEKVADDVTGDTVTVPSHPYKNTGKYTAKVTVFDEDDNDKSITKTIFIGDGTQPIARITLLVNGVEVPDLEETIEVNRKDVLTFDASESVNLDGTGRLLKYSWDFGTTSMKKSAEKTLTRSYKELSPEAPGYFKVKLTVTDKDNPALTATESFKIQVVSVEPSFSNILAIPRTKDGNLITPVVVDMSAYGAGDPDGEIISYRWWYFDPADPEEALGIQITKTPNAQLTIGTRGKEGQKVEYGFGLEVTDSDGKKYSSTELFDSGNYPTVEVVNGRNALPKAKFTIDKAKVFTGEKVNFTSNSSDEDGAIIQYVWDFEGDGFYNNEPVKNSVAEHTYTKKNLTGYSVRLKVIDDKGGEAVSDPINIYVDSNAADPVAAFTFDAMEGADGRVKFTSNSKADEKNGAKIVKYMWDFDTKSTQETADGDGDGILDNDVESTEASPEWIYLNPGTYTVKLTVMDTNDSKDSVERFVTIVISGQSAAGQGSDYFGGTGVDNGASGGVVGGSDTGGQSGTLKAILVTDPVPSSDNIVYLAGTLGSVTFDFSKSTGVITYYILDKNIYFDTDGDGIKNNDQDFKTTLPGSWKTNFDKSWGQTVVKLTVKDIYGNESSVTQEIKFK